MIKSMLHFIPERSDYMPNQMYYISNEDKYYVTNHDGTTIKCLDDRELNNYMHMENPKEGDIWHDMLKMVYLVMKVNGLTVTVCDKVIVTDDGQTFDTTQTRTVTKRDFKDLICYPSKELSTTPMLDVYIPRAS